MSLDDRDGIAAGRSSDRASTARGVCRIAALAVVGILWLLVAMMLIGVSSLFGQRARYVMITRLTSPFCRSVAAVIGLKIRIEGRRDPGTLIFVGNHVTWLDILLSGVCVGGVFVSRHDLREWPAIGIFSRLAGTIFIDRSSLRSAIASSQMIGERAAEGIRVVFFPEGGAGNGDDVAPFKAFLFGGIVDAGLPIQPCTLRYTHIGGAPITPANRDLVYWYRPDQNFATHAWGILRRSSVRSEFVFHPPVSPPAAPDRAALRAYVERVRMDVKGVKEGEVAREAGEV